MPPLADALGRLVLSAECPEAKLLHARERGRERGKHSRGGRGHLWTALCEECTRRGEAGNARSDGGRGRCSRRGVSRCRHRFRAHGSRKEAEEVVRDARHGGGGVVGDGDGVEENGGGGNADRRRRGLEST